MIINDNKSTNANIGIIAAHIINAGAVNPKQGKIIIPVKLTEK